MRSLFVGLGEMGIRMARRIRGKNLQLSVYDSNSSRMDEFGDKLTNLTNVEYNTIMTMLPSDQALERLFLGETDLLNRLPKSSTIIDFSTASYACSRAICQAASSVGIKFIDSPVSGGVKAAEQGQLTLLMGCVKEEVAAQEAVLDSMSINRFYLGERGKGIVAKLCNNFVLMSNMAATCEAIESASKYGISRKEMVSILDSCSGQSWVTTKYSPVPMENGTLPASHDYSGGFKTRLALKDLTLMNELVEKHNLPSQLIHPVLKIYSELVEKGQGDKDFGVYLKILKGRV